MRWNVEQYPVGTRVRCADPEDFLTHLGRQLRGREGFIASHQMFSGAPIVKFPAVGRRKELQWVPPHPRDIEVLP